jgi:negative regulator of sigma E activity
MRILIAVVMLIAIAGLWQYNQKVSAQTEKAAIAAQNHKPFKPFDSRQVRTPSSIAGSIVSQPAPSVTTKSSANPQFTCDGRTHCSQMRSCAEATFFLQNCPNTQMDGNNDGEPCEQQWCN